MANPSIGPSIGEMSLGNSLSISGSHIDRIGALWEETSDHKSSSQRAVAGESREGSVIDSSYQLVGAASHRSVDMLAAFSLAELCVNCNTID